MGAMRLKKQVLLSFLLVIGLSGCYQAFTTPQLEALEAPSATAKIDPILTPTPTPTKQPPVSVPVTATVWQEAPRAPVLMYHRFDLQDGAAPEEYKISLADFDAQLAALYAAGYSLVPLEDWLQGEIKIPEGRKPLILTIDDLFYADQISLDENGAPASYSAIGRLWQFANTHPDFGFSAALLYNLGDKPYANSYTNGVFSVQDGWRHARAEAIAWAVQHGAMPMNHFYEHPNLSNLSPEAIQAQMAENDRALREALAMVDAAELTEGLPNILAVPYGVWPDTEAGKQVLYDYVSPEGASVSAILEATAAAGGTFLQAPFSPDFNPWHIPRMSATWETIDRVVEWAEEMPTSSTCAIGDFTINPHLDLTAVSEAILDRTEADACPEGYYFVDSFVFQVQGGEITRIFP